MTKKPLFYRIGEACKQLDIQPYVLRYWETEFSMLSPGKSRSGQRVYDEEDLDVIRRIKELLYEEGFTIAGAKKRLESELASGGPRLRRRQGEDATAREDRLEEELPSGDADAEPDDLESGLESGGDDEPMLSFEAEDQAASGMESFGSESELTGDLEVAAEGVDEHGSETVEDPEEAPEPNCDGRAEEVDSELDTAGEERVQQLREGVRLVLREARELLVLLEVGSPPVK